MTREDHTLEVGVTYTPSTPEALPRTFRKMYNFTTFDTIAVRSMSLPSPTHARSVIFQMHIENIGNEPFTLTSLNFHPEPQWDVVSCNRIESNTLEGTEGRQDGELGVFGEGWIEPRGVVQSLFVLSPKVGVEGEMPFALGRVEIGWAGAMGEKGSSITGLMKRRPA